MSLDLEVSLLESLLGPSEVFITPDRDGSDAQAFHWHRKTIYPPETCSDFPRESWTVCVNPGMGTDHRDISFDSFEKLVEAIRAKSL